MLLYDYALTEFSGGNDAVCHRPSTGSGASSALAPGTPYPEPPIDSSSAHKPLSLSRATWADSDEMPNNPLPASERPDTGRSTPTQLTSSLVSRLSHPMKDM